MFHWKLFFILVAVSIPGIFFIIPAVKNSHAVLKQKLPSNKALPSERVMIAISGLQSLILVAMASALGTALSYKVDLHAPFFEAIAMGQNGWVALQPQIWPACWVGFCGASLFLLAYYFMVCPNLDKQTVQTLRRVRLKAGILARIFYGGILEEIITRWGLMTFFLWLGVLLVGSPSAPIVWVAIIVSGVLFGLLHLPAYLSAGCKKSANFIAATIGLNLWASLIFGWLYWHFGLCSAMIAHAIFHIIWYPIDRFVD